jgi:hypothetical protein
MAATYNATVANARLTVVRDAVDQGAAAGVLVIGTSALNGGATGTLVTFTLDDPCGSVANRVLTLDGTPISAVASAGGIAAKAELRDSDGVVICSGLTVGIVGSAADIIVDTAAIVSTRTVYLLSGTITHP